ncbi:U3 small nucleolar RNA-associated protein [Lachnellula subtilissima]|uniref:U3 small nucleolar RNA-associated protein 22 n=1 Tax=Lachnellula subtilissima TaxID=602034 RepID=A0A8H8RWZ2_9HELO|nr:U3 small nucleolar RNA-associated protein [Lachnellula subtilissima]
MSHIPSKRRKLDHEVSDESDESPNSPSNELHSAFEDSDEEEALDVHAPATTAKQAQPQPHSQPKRAKDDDESALYAAGLYKSSMFKLQVDEMLAEVRPNYGKRFSGADDALRQLKSVIEAIEDREALSVIDATKLLQKSHKVTIPFPDPKPDKNAAYKLAYAKPSNINIVGSYALKAMVKADSVLSIDMVIVMPEPIFQEKDYLNYRYFYKRSYYLACIVAGIQETVKDQFSLDFEYLNGNTLHPILVAKPKSNKEKSPLNYRINIIPAAPQTLFSESKLRPTKNAVRPKENAGHETTLPPTPFYNASLRSDANFEAYLKLLHSASKQSAGFVDACLLGRIWLRQRGFGSDVSEGGFGHFEWASFTALLLKGGGSKGHSVLSPGYSSYQTFKAVVQFLSTTDLASKPLIYESPDFSGTKSDVPVFYDGPRGQNILYKMTPWSYALLRDEAKASLDMLNDAAFDQFESTFILRTSQPLQRYDCILSLPVPARAFDSSTCDHVSQVTRFSLRLFDVLREGLSDRVKLINIKSSKPSSWSTKSSGPILPGQSLLVSVVFDPANIDRLVDHGPAAEEKKKAAKFQKFWGEKAELRRFKDGSILESLVWKTGSTYSIFQDIVSYLIKRHFDEEVSQGLRLIGESFEKALPSSAASSKLFETLKQAYNTFEKNVRDLEGLPLQLRQLSAISPQLRNSSIDPPSFSPQRPLKTPAAVLIQFEGSGRWPDDIVAIQRTKIAFLLKIGSLLQDADASITTRVGLENEDQKLQNCSFLDVIYESGAVFRLRIHNDREQTLLERLVKDKSTDPRTREDAVAASSLYKRTFIQLPLLNQSISTHCTRFPLLSPTIRLVKLWFDRHMLSGHVSEELIELIVASIFLQPYPWRAPSSVMTGFLRTLMFISRWDWRLVPLIVDFTGTMTRKDVSSINTRLEAWRKIDPGMNRTVLFAASNHDTTGVAFTDKGPSRMAAARMTALAVSAYKLVKDKGVELDQRSLFATSTADYDFVVHISPIFAADQRRKEASKHKFKNLEVQSEANLELVGYNPVQLCLSELEKLYANSVVFFHSEVSGSVIAGLWNPQHVVPRSFKVNMTYATKIFGDSEEGKIGIDKSAILLEIARLGGDMVSRIEVNR